MDNILARIMLWDGARIHAFDQGFDREATLLFGVPLECNFWLGSGKFRE